ncbi:hypothetical protein [Streptomyces sp. TS71-3]|uniref:hypothetical protein n=1 Tax=Streptomyces sp. TS71-3 TaxID=2733862 RepID=UPI001B1C46E1|nr:hypothetical protein [Streptomyces sp. TS71-3]GHJ34934.1 hypothetical protein Sm713_05430 [Streptomyces sp. TS71-3]
MTARLWQAADAGDRPPAGSAPPADDAEQRPEEAAPGAAVEEDSESEEHSRQARAAQRELFTHAPDFIPASFGGSLVGGAQHVVSGGHLTGDVYLGGRTEIHHHAQVTETVGASGQIPAAALERLDRAFVADHDFTAALGRLREERVLVLSGAHGSGRSTAAQVLLHRLGVPAVRALQPDLAPGALPTHLTFAGGYVLADLPLSRNKPLRQTHLYAMREQLAKVDGYLVLTVASTAHVIGASPFHWRRPAVDEVLRAHLAVLCAGRDDVGRLLALTPVGDFLAQGHHRIAEAADFARALAAFDGTEQGIAQLAGFGMAAVEHQCRTWLADARLPLRDKAFLISLALLDDAPYVLAAELADVLFVEFQRLQHPATPPEIPVFGPSPDERLELARAVADQRTEQTEWGPISQYMTRFAERGTARALLTEVWTGHPSARPALVAWLKRLAQDKRPLVRTRAAAGAALLAAADLPSAVALLIDGWAASRSFRPRVMAANALTLAQLLDVTAILPLLTRWCDDPDWARRWTAIRALSLLASHRPALAGPALNALAGRARTESGSEAERRNLIESTALLLSGGEGGEPEEMLSELVRLLYQDSTAVRALVLGAFVLAGENTDEGALVEWYAETGVASPQATRDLATLWRAALNDRGETRRALDAMRLWVSVAEQRSDALHAVEHLLPLLISTAADRDRLAHLLRTLPRDDAGTRPQIAEHLLAVVSRAPAAGPTPS